MLQILVTAETVSELKSKTLVALNMFEVPQASLPVPTTQPPTPEALKSVPASVPSANAPTLQANPMANGDAEAPLANLAHINQKTGTRTRRTKAEIEAERLAKNSTAKNAGEIIQNNFEAGDAHAEVDGIDDVDAADLMGEVAAPTAPAVDLATAQKALGELLKKISTPQALSLLEKHGAKKVTLMTDTQRASFYAEAQKMIRA